MFPKVFLSVLFSGISAVPLYYYKTRSLLVFSNKALSTLIFHDRISLLKNMQKNELSGNGGVFDMWNAGLYNSFEKERIQPSVDLAARLDGSFARILDVGCGSGMSTLVLRRQFPNAYIVGADLSKQMLEKAKELKIEAEWIQRDCGESLRDFGKFDLIFSNAFLQWLSDQEKFIEGIRDNMAADSILAMQIPNFSAMKIAELIEQTANEYGAGLFSENHNCKNYSLQEYYDIFSKYFKKVEVWQTNYVHQFASSDRIVDFVKGTALIPYLDKLSDEGKEEFMGLLRRKTKEAYRPSANGMVLFPFERLFYVAKEPI